MFYIAGFVTQSLILHLVTSQDQLSSFKTGNTIKNTNNTLQNIRFKSVKSSQANTLLNALNDNKTIKLTNNEPAEQKESTHKKALLAFGLNQELVHQNPLPNESDHQKDIENVNHNKHLLRQPETEPGKVYHELNNEDKMELQNVALNENRAYKMGLQNARLDKLRNGKESRSIDEDTDQHKRVSGIDDAAESKIDGVISEEQFEIEEFEQHGDGKMSLDLVDAHISGNDQFDRPNWPMGVVPYYINRTIFDDIAIGRITEAMELIESVSCVVFTEVKNAVGSAGSAWLHITNPDNERECAHNTPEELNSLDEILVVMGFDCMRPEEVLHTLLHAIGMLDEVTHPRRDHYIRVLWENIQPKYRPLFSISHSARVVSEYDPASVMHFHDRAFTANGAPTVAALIPGLRIAPSRTLSQLDVLKLKLTFGHACKARQVNGLFDQCKMAMPNKQSHKHITWNDQYDDQENNDEDEENRKESKDSGERNEISVKESETESSDSKKTVEDRDKSTDDGPENEDNSQIEIRDRNRFSRIRKRT